jgi:hypothetical protein
MAEERTLRLELPRVAYRQFEVRGYDKMIERILGLPLGHLKTVITKSWRTNFY